MQEAPIQLPIIDNQSKLKIKRSRNAPRRAFVLLSIHLLIATHIAHWWVTGRTISPVEPSESMKTLELGELNAGAIFFALAIFSTLVFGRFFCGWGCHLVALQDLCGWMMKKLGVQPKPFRSRLLVYIPLGLAVYMFLWPTLKRLAIAPLLEPVWPAIRSDLRIGSLPPAGFSDHLTTTEFWSTFAGIGVAIPFFLICGFACVYFLGSKGFCTYGCPYGGIFGPANLVSAGAIVVDADKCDHSGHCTARCTSNVNVSEEIKAFGRVVDPGCMKCMDCISVCPNSALSFKFVRPSIFKKRSSGPRPARHFDTTLREDAALLIVFMLVLLATRGAYDLIPLLMAVGIAACTTFLAWKLSRMRRDPSVSLMTLRLKQNGSIRPTGLAFLATSLIAAVLLAHTGVVNCHHWRADTLHRRLTIPINVLLVNPMPTIDAELIETAQRALDHDESADAIGILMPFSSTLRRAYCHLVLGERVEAEALLFDRLDHFTRTDSLVADLGRIIASDPRRKGEALDHYRHELAGHPNSWRTREQATLLLIGSGRADEAVTRSKAALDEMASDPLLRGVRARTRLSLARALSAMNQGAQAVDQLAIAVNESPHDPVVRENCAAALFQVRGDLNGAIEQLRIAFKYAPNDERLQQRLEQLELLQPEKSASP